MAQRANAKSQAKLRKLSDENFQHLMRETERAISVAQYWRIKYEQEVCKQKYGERSH